MGRELELGTQKIIGRIDDDGIGWLIFNHPERHNALSLEMWQGIGDVLEAYANDPEVRVAIMRGAGGKAFISGADISEFDSKRSSSTQKDEYGRIAGRANRWLARFDKPLHALGRHACRKGKQTPRDREHSPGFEDHAPPGCSLEYCKNRECAAIRIPPQSGHRSSGCQDWFPAVAAVCLRPRKLMLP